MFAASRTWLVVAQTHGGGQTEGEWGMFSKLADSCNYVIHSQAKHHSSSWGRFMQQYRDLVRRVQTRHGLTRPKVPFDFQQISDYMDLKKSKSSFPFSSRYFVLLLCSFSMFFDNC